jgi:RimJ/RimL family protein N-acetyltransferase
LTTPTAGSSHTAVEGPGFVLRTLTPADAAAYRYLRLAALSEMPPAFSTSPDDEARVPLKSIAERLYATPDVRILGAFNGDRLIGMARFTRHAGTTERHKAYITGIYVTPEWRRRGCARALVRAVITQASALPGLRRLNLGVGVDNGVAIALYESLGFRRWGTEEEAFIRDGVAYGEHFMALVLPPRLTDLPR